MKIHKDCSGWELKEYRQPTKKELKEQEYSELRSAMLWAVYILGTGLAAVIVHLV